MGPEGLNCRFIALSTNYRSATGTYLKGNMDLQMRRENVTCHT
jgi:hypothetical protein